MGILLLFLPFFALLGCGVNSVRCGPPPAEERCGLEWLSVPPALVPELNCIPPRRYFAMRQWDLLARELTKLREKRDQIEYLLGVVLRRVEASRGSGRPVRHVVDFGGGRGDFALCLAWLLRERGFGDTAVTVVELEETLCQQGRRRAAALAADCSPGALPVRFANMTIRVRLRGAVRPRRGAARLRTPGGRGPPAVPAGGRRVRAAHVLLREDPEAGWGPRAGVPQGGGRPGAREGGLLRALQDRRRPHGPRLHAGHAHPQLRPLRPDAPVGRLGGARGDPPVRHQQNIIVAGVAAASLAGPVDVARGEAPLPRVTGVSLSPGPPNQAPGTLRVVIISDTHSRHRELTVPPGDLLVVAGDFTKSGTRQEVEDFALWLDGLQFQEKVVVAGNHEVTFDPGYYEARGHAFHKGPERVDAAEVKRLVSSRPGLRYLENGRVSLEFGGQRPPVCVFGSPCQAATYGEHTMAAFTCSKEDEEGDWAPLLAQGRSGPPVDILVTHGPPYGIGDLSTDGCPDGSRASPGGSRPLLRAVREMRPVLHAFGHMHEGYGASTDGLTLFVNGAMCERYVAQRLPIVVDLPRAEPGGGRGLRAAEPGGGPPPCWQARPASASSYGDSGRPHHQGTSPLFWRLMEDLHARPELHVATGCSGYRNKASLSLGELFAPQDSCAPELNRVASWLQASALSSAGSGLWVEAALKLTRRGSLGVKVILRGREAAEEWVRDRSGAWWAELRRDLPFVSSVTYQVAPADSDEKPPKSPWHPRYQTPTALFGDPFVLEGVPGGTLSQPAPAYRLSPDTFSEVNTPAEDAMFEVLSEWVCGLRGRGEAQVLGMFGRNCGLLGLALQHRFDFRRVYARTHCPVTIADVQASVEMLPPHLADLWDTGRCEKYDFGAAMAAIPEGQGKMLVHVTNSRHGLADGIIPALKARRDITAVAYNSCSHLPLPAEWQELFSGPGAFQLAAFRSFDLLAGTEFMSSYFLLVRRPPMLVLPIGPPGVGKSWLARRLAPACEVFERDRAFFEEMMREGGGLAGAKRRTHARLQRALEAAGRAGCALLVDSTNGRRDGREMLQQAYASAAGAAARVVIAALRAPAGDEGLLHRRLRERCASAESPEHERLLGGGALRPGATDEELGAKVRRVLEGIEYPDTRAAGEGAALVLEASAGDHDAVDGLLWSVFQELCCPDLSPQGPRGRPADASAHLPPPPPPPPTPPP
ncbi:unnamed protein product [Prorocentrum cordatum]|uniref:Calcineurin-like phosphoesterase domain-containing protein n=1 Tax=Prorocentrum cordatum TaxID=2364126 RepID=A0ABN9SY47_9DINO|nr:unnamed protein product [Polarella glacialis]